MISKTTILNAANGLHARPAGDLVKLAKTFAASNPTLASNGKTVKATSMFGVLSLGLTKGSEITVSAEDAAAAEAMADFIENIKD